MPYPRQSALVALEEMTTRGWFHDGFSGSSTQSLEGTITFYICVPATDSVGLRKQSGKVGDVTGRENVSLAGTGLWVQSP